MRNHDENGPIEIIRINKILENDMELLAKQEKNQFSRPRRK
jgi:hypothetical protein